MAERMKDKVVIVTGAGAGASSRGWGNRKAAAVLYAREGAQVWAVDCHLDRAQDTQRIIASEGGPCTAFHADVADSAQVLRMVETCIAQHGRIDVLHNNVGIVEVGGAVEASEDSWHRVIAANQTSMFLTCKHKHVLPHMVARKSGAIVNIGSVAG